MNTETPLPRDLSTAATTNEAAQRASLARKKQIAGLLLLVALVLLAVATVCEHQHPHWGWRCLSAFAEAALVGGLADWFAVVALFRRPMGLKIPHTAIIPQKKDQIGESLANFVHDHFLGTEQLVDKIRTFDPAHKLSQALSTPANAEKVADIVVRSLPSLVNLLDSEELHRFIYTSVRNKSATTDVAAALGRLLDLLTRGDRHKKAVDGVLAGLHRKLQSPQLHEVLRQKIGEKITKIGRAVGLDSYAAEKLTDFAVEQVEEVLADPNHALRQEINEQIQAFIHQLRHDADLRAKVAALRDDLIGNESVAAYLRALWKDILGWLRNDLQRDDSSIRGNVRQAAFAIGGMLTKNAEIRQLFNSWCVDTAKPLITDYREAVRNYIVERVKAWNAHELTEQLELTVGADLQYIRYNGTVIGGVIGMIIFGAIQLLQAVM
jgi:uncharacterized membrane-anchored protein YjiN (DUF445 family)